MYQLIVISNNSTGFVENNVIWIRHAGQLITRIDAVRRLSSRVFHYSRWQNTLTLQLNPKPHLLASDNPPSAYATPRGPVDSFDHVKTHAAANITKHEAFHLTQPRLYLGVVPPHTQPHPSTQSGNVRLGIPGPQHNSPS